METNTILSVTADNARKAYLKADNSGKQLLDDLFPNSKWHGNVIERVTNVQEARLELGIPDSVDIYANDADEYDRAVTDILIVAKAIREGKPESECFYYPYFYLSSGGGFSFGGYACDRDCSYVGARLRVDTKEKAIHLGKCMLESYRIMLTGKY